MNKDTAASIHRSALRLVRMLRSSGRNGAVFSLLGLLYREGAMTATDAAAELRIQPQSLTRLIASMQKDGLITKRQDAADKRKTMLEISPIGTDTLVKEIGGQRALLAEIIEDKLTETEKQLLSLAAGLLDRITEEAEKLR